MTDHNIVAARTHSWEARPTVLVDRPAALQPAVSFDMIQHKKYERGRTPETKIATEAGMLISKHRIQRNTLTHTLVDVVQFHSVQVHVYTCTSYPLWGL